MDAYYKLPLPAIDSVRASFPEEFARLDALSSTLELEKFGVEARSRASSEAWRQVSRYAAIREIQSRVAVPSSSIADQYIEDCVTERVWAASLSIGEVDAVTARLINQHGFLGGMIEQLKPMNKVGAGNFPALHKAGLIDCTAEYCVWKWGRDFIDQALRGRLDALATQYGFAKY
jgi:hypothetical protein